MPEVMPKKILVPVDLSEGDRKALIEAAEIAQFCKAGLVVMYADESRAELEAIETPTTIATTDAEKKAATEKYLTEEIAHVVPSGVPVQSMVVEGRAAPEILKVADETAADWIVMATHGRSGFKRLTMGSVTEEVLRHSTKPVLAVHTA